MLASILLKEDEELSAERLEGAVRALRRIHLRRRQEQVQRELTSPALVTISYSGTNCSWKKIALAGP